MPALAIATSIAAEALDRPATARWSASKSVTSASKRDRALAEPRGVLLQALGLEADERDVRALGVQPLGASPRRCRAPRR